MLSDYSKAPALCGVLGLCLRGWKPRTWSNLESLQPELLRDRESLTLSDMLRSLASTTSSASSCHQVDQPERVMAIVAEVVRSLDYVPGMTNHPAEAVHTNVVNGCTSLVLTAVSSCLVIVRF